MLIGLFCQAAAACLVKGEHLPNAAFLRDGLNLRYRGRIADDDGRCCIAEEILDLRRLVGGVERQIDEARPQAGKIEDDRLNRLACLHRDPVSRDRAERGEQIRHLRGLILKIAEADCRHLRSLKGDLGEVSRKPAFKQGIEIIVSHRFSFFL